LPSGIKRITIGLHSAYSIKESVDKNPFLARFKPMRRKSPYCTGVCTIRGFPLLKTEVRIYFFGKTFGSVLRFYFLPVELIGWGSKIELSFFVWGILDPQ